MPRPAVLFPDVATVAIQGLTSGFTAENLAVPVSNETPDPLPAEYVTARRLGGVRRSLVVDEAQIAYECFGTTVIAAHDIAQIARAISLALAGTKVGDVVVYRVTELSGPAELPHPTSESARVVFSHFVAVRGVALNP
jgi:hypothetical protein